MKNVLKIIHSLLIKLAIKFHDFQNYRLWIVVGTLILTSCGTKRHISKSVDKTSLHVVVKTDSVNHLEQKAVDYHKDEQKADRRIDGGIVIVEDEEIWEIPADTCYITEFLNRPLTASDSALIKFLDATYKPIKITKRKKTTKGNINFSTGTYSSRADLQLKESKSGVAVKKELHIDSTRGIVAHDKKVKEKGYKLMSWIIIGALVAASLSLAEYLSPGWFLILIRKLKRKLNVTIKKLRRSN